MTLSLGGRTVAAAFAHDRDADRAMRMIAMFPEIPVSFHKRDVIGERGDVQMVVLEATVDDATQADRVEKCMLGAHGVRIPFDAAVQAARAS
jgi:hypothetical protein